MSFPIRFVWIYLVLYLVYANVKSSCIYMSYLVCSICQNWYHHPLLKQVLHLHSPYILRPCFLDMNLEYHENLNTAWRMLGSQ